jgi:signal transduction histidine kinase
MNKKTLYAFIVSFLLLIAVIILNRLSFREMRNYSERVDHARQVISQFETISDHFKSAQIYTPTHDSIELKNFYLLYKRDAESLNGELETLKQFVKDNPQQSKLADTLARRIRNEMPLLFQKNITEIIETGDGFHLNHFFEIHNIINRGIQFEGSLLIERKKKLTEFTTLSNLLTTAFGVIAVSILFFTFFSIFFLSRQRQWLEGFLESILNTSENGIVHYKAIRKEGRIVDFKVEFVNRAMDKLLHINSAEVIGKRLSEISSHVVGNGQLEKYKEVVETGRPAEFETLYQRDDVQRWLLVSLVKLNDGLTASFHNISQLKKYEAELKENIQELERSNTELEQYAYVASHDLQEPLRKIRSFGSYLQDTQKQKLDARGQEHLEKIISAAERMSALIKDILSFSSLRRSDLFVPTDLNKIIDGITQDLDLMITQKNAIIEKDELPVIEAIPLQMNQLFYNLINNSLKFSRQDVPPLIRISSRKVTGKELPSTLDRNIDHYEISVSDNGIGFSQEYAEQVFGLFKRLNERHAYPGSGIGLALCRKVVENHHGEIRAEGKEKEGAVFYIYLPERVRET